ncbi:MAG TPA: FecR family protein, partial [Thermodesulfobacteriota bacterium]|nr:FecR family protein [Thermodesulfobacteriota bacterium]
IEIRLPDRSLIRFDSRSTVKVKTLLFDASDGSREIRTEVSGGKAWMNVRKAFGPKKTFEVASVNAVAGVRDTVWRMNVEADRSTLIRVYEGTIEVYNPFVRSEPKPQEGGTPREVQGPREVRGPQEVPRPYREVTRDQWEQIVLTGMMQVVVPPSGTPPPPTSFQAEEDQREEWVLWNRNRDRETPP